MPTQLINRYRTPRHFSTAWLDSKHTAAADAERQVAAFDTDGNPILIVESDISGSGGGGGSGGPSAVYRISTDTVLDETYDAALIVLENTTPITITLPAFTNLNSFVFFKKISSTAHTVTLLPYSGATIDGETSMTIDTQYMAIYVFYPETDTFFIL
jgi:hypothetical protein